MCTLLLRSLALAGIAGATAVLSLTASAGRAVPATPVPVTGLSLVEYDAQARTAVVSWDSDEPAEGPSVVGYLHRTRLDGGAWSDWIATADPQTDGDGLSAQPGQLLEVEVVAVGEAGDDSPVADWSGVVPSDSEVLGGSGEILQDDGSVPPTSGPPEFPQPTSTPDVAVPSGTAPEASYARFEFDPAETGVDVVLNGVAQTRPGTLGLTGVVVDGQTGEPVPGASLKLTSGSADATTTSDAEGGYAFAEIPPSSDAQLTVSASGYASYRLDGISYRSDDEYELTVRLSTPSQP